MTIRDKVIRKLLVKFPLCALLFLVLLPAMAGILVVYHQRITRLGVQLHDLNTRVELGERIRQVELKNELLRQQRASIQHELDTTSTIMKARR